jgi:VanW like protein/Glycosyl transferases group 1
MISAPDRVAEAVAPAAAERTVPGRWASAVFQSKVFAYRLRRAIADFGSRPRRLAKSAGGIFPAIVAESRTPLWPLAQRSGAPSAERLYELGKVQNLRRAAARLDGIVIPAGGVFSFWRQLGRTSRRRGFVTGRMLQEGCLVPATGGGLCQLSNALYDAALQAGCEIVERHAHSRVVAGSAAAFGRDATVAWNYVDLRFRSSIKLQIEARLSRDQLVIRFRSQSSGTAAPAPLSGLAGRGRAAQSCGTCGETACFRHEHGPKRAIAPRTAYLVDENWPEFQAYIAKRCGPDDALGVPVDGGRWHLPRYRWHLPGVSVAKSAMFPTLARAIAIRRAPAQGPARRLAELRGAERIAGRLATLLRPDITTVCVAQSLLPYLWRDGHLGGRQVGVLMTRLPMAALQARLDVAFSARPERGTLGDFRAPPALVEAEAEALAYASRIVTPHEEIARLFPDTSVRLDWRLPAAGPIGRQSPIPRRVAFPGPTIARKGAHAVRAAARALGLEIVVLGGELEGPDFWNGVAARRVEPGEDWLAWVAAVVQPAIAEERPRHLLAALAAGVPIIATAACGLGAQEGVTLVPADDPDALIAALGAVLA